MYVLSQLCIYTGGGGVNSRHPPSWTHPCICIYMSVINNQYANWLDSYAKFNANTHKVHTLWMYTLEQGSSHNAKCRHAK